VSPAGCSARDFSYSAVPILCAACAVRSIACRIADAWRDDDALYVQFDLPGMDRSSIDLTVERGTLTLAAHANPSRIAISGGGAKQLPA
jgi:hypothetical protein